jgi:fermentation-respiration switch protein FrsA (DUF1100 family)
LICLAKQTQDCILMKKDIVTIIIFSLAAYPVVVMAAHYSQSYAIFQSRGVSLPPPRHLNIDERFLATPDGQRLYAWWLQTGAAKKTVLYFQANGTNISQKIFRLETFKEMGVNALMIDYRGYGKSTGRIRREQHIYTDGQTAWNYLVDEKRIDPKDIIVWGRSLGGAVAAEIARGKKIAALVLESTFVSLDTVARRQYWFLPTTRLLKFHFENGRKLKQVRSPVVIIHSMEDDYVTFNQARELYEAAPEPRYLIETTGSHIDSFDRRQAFFGSSVNRSGDRQQVLSRVMKSIGLDTATDNRHYQTGGAAGRRLSPVKGRCRQHPEKGVQASGTGRKICGPVPLHRKRSHENSRHGIWRPVHSQRRWPGDCARRSGVG